MGPIYAGNLYGGRYRRPHHTTGSGPLRSCGCRDYPVLVSGGASPRLILQPQSKTIVEWSSPSSVPMIGKKSSIRWWSVILQRLLFRADPLPRRIACFMGGTMNIGIGLAFLHGSSIAAYVLGGILFALQFIVISTHFCVASWMYEGVLRLFGRWTAPVSEERGMGLMETGGHLIDVRSPEEFARGHLSGARNSPLDSLANDFQEPKEQIFLLYC